MHEASQATYQPAIESAHSSTNPPTYQSTHQSIQPLTHLYICTSIVHLLIYVYMHPAIQPSSYTPTYPFSVFIYPFMPAYVYTCIHLHIHLSIYNTRTLPSSHISIYPSTSFFAFTHPSIHRSIQLYFHPSIHPFLLLSKHPPTNAPTHPSRQQASLWVKGSAHGDPVSKGLQSTLRQILPSWFGPGN